jgi:hypothetical protein
VAYCIKDEGLSVRAYAMLRDIDMLGLPGLPGRFIANESNSGRFECEALSKNDIDYGRSPRGADRTFSNSRLEKREFRTRHRETFANLRYEYDC